MARGDVVNPTQQVAIDYADEDVRVNSVSFGFVDTPMTEALLKTERFCAFLDRIGIHARPLEGEFHALDLLIRLDQRRRHRLDALGIGAPLGELHRRWIVRFQHVDDDPANRGLRDVGSGRDKKAPVRLSTSRWGSRRSSSTTPRIRELR